MNKELLSAKSTFSVYFLAALFIFIFIHTFGRNELGPYFSPFLWFVSGILSCVLLIYSNWFKTSSEFHKVGQSQGSLNQKVVAGLGLLVFGTSVFSSGKYLRKLIRKYPIKVEESDIIPSIQIFVQRFLDGDVVYESIQYPGYTSIPTYLTLTWFPFVPAELLDFDYRWLPFILFVSVLVVMTYQAWKRRSNLLSWSVFVLSAAFILVGLTKTDDANLRFGVEFLPACYYLVLIMSLNSRHWFVIAAGILLCLLSRYSFLFWLPAYAYIVWKERGSMFSMKVTLAVITGVLAFYVIPFIGLNFDIIFDGLRFYAANAPSKWTTFDWQPEGAKPYHLKQGYALTLFFYDVFQQNIPEGITWIKRTQFALIILVSIATIVTYHKYRNRIQNIEAYLAASLGLYMLVFYSFMYAPYGYLYFVPLSVVLGAVWQAGMRPKADVGRTTVH